MIEPWCEDNEMDRIKLVETCGACPEQYDAYYKGDQIGYLRLRHGTFYCEYLPSGERVYESHPEGDGIFAEHERHHHLNLACNALLQKIKEYDTPTTYEIVNEDDV